MQNNDIEQLSTAELKAMAASAANIPTILAQRRELELIKLHDDVINLCTERGYTMSDVIGVFEPKLKLPPLVKYRHPETGETWAGCGRRPRWLHNYLNVDGNLLEDLAV